MTLPPGFFRRIRVVTGVAALGEAVTRGDEHVQL